MTLPARGSPKVALEGAAARCSFTRGSARSPAGGRLLRRSPRLNGSAPLFLDDVKTLSFAFNAMTHNAMAHRSAIEKPHARVVRRKRRDERVVWDPDSFVPKGKMTWAPRLPRRCSSQQGATAERDIGDASPQPESSAGLAAAPSSSAKQRAKTPPARDGVARLPLSDPAGRHDVKILMPASGWGSRM